MKGAKAPRWSCMWYCKNAACWGLDDTLQSDDLLCYWDILYLHSWFEVCSMHIMTYNILSSFSALWSSIFPCRQLVLQKTFSDGALAEILVMATLQTNDWQKLTLRKFRKSFVDRDSSWKGLTLASRCCCHSNVWHQKPLEGHEPDIVLNAIWRLTVHKHPSWFRIDRTNKTLRWFRGVDALVTQHGFCILVYGITSRPLRHGHWQRLPTHPGNPRFASIDLGGIQQTFSITNVMQV